MATNQAPVTSSQPWLHQHGQEIQPFGTVRQFPFGLPSGAVGEAVHRPPGRQKR